MIAMAEPKKHDVQEEKEDGVLPPDRVDRFMTRAGDLILVSPGTDEATPKAEEEAPPSRR